MSVRVSRMSNLERSYCRVLTRIADSLTNSDKMKLKFWLDRYLPSSVLETGQPLTWFSEMRRSGLIAVDDLAFLLDFLKCSGRLDLHEEVRRYESERKSVEKSARKKANRRQMKSNKKGYVCMRQSFRRNMRSDSQCSLNTEKRYGSPVFHVENLFEKLLQPKVLTILNVGISVVLTAMVFIVSNQESCPNSNF